LPKPTLVHALPTDDKTRDATITLLQFEKWGLTFRSPAIVEDQEQINRKVSARCSDVREKQFSSLGANRERIKRYLKEVLSPRLTHSLLKPRILRSDTHFITDIINIQSL